MSGGESISGEDVIEVLDTLAAIENGELDEPSKAIEEAKEPGLNEHQRAVAAKYAGEGRVTVDDSTTPNLLEKLKTGAELPWTFVLDGVQFVMKAKLGEGGNPSRWKWTEDGYRFSYLKYDDRENTVRIEEVDDAE